MFDVLVIGAGHAGCEAAAAAARRGARVGLLTFRPEDAGQMSCNPSIGGVGKGHLVRELDVFDGLMARAADHAAIHRRMLNRSKGPAVWGPRIQADRKLYRAAVGGLLAETGVEVVVAEALRLTVANGRITGIVTSEGTLDCRAIVIATGTFLELMIPLRSTTPLTAQTLQFRVNPDLGVFGYPQVGVYVTGDVVFRNDLEYDQIVPDVCTISGTTLCQLVQ